jgi:ABC-type lipoprotein export system ATPase subunit
VSSPVSEPVIDIAGVSRNYQGLRPLRIARLSVGPGERVSIAGLDLPAAELLVNLITGATLPDEGEVRVFGRRTADISSGDDWLASLDRLGIVSERAVLLEGATLQQNLAMPFTLEIDPVAPGTAARVERLAVECGIASEWLQQRTADLPPEVRLRAHVARAVALDPALLLVEHPTAQVPEHARGALAVDVSRLAESRGLTLLVVTNDQPFARSVAPRNLKLNGATGEMVPTGFRGGSGRVPKAFKVPKGFRVPKGSWFRTVRDFLKKNN